MTAEMKLKRFVADERADDLRTAGGPRSEGERSEPEHRWTLSEKAAGLEPVKKAERPDPEVPAKAQRRKYSAEYKQRILEEANACRVTGTIGALLRREGLCSSILTSWRRQHGKGQLEGLTPKKRGRKNQPIDPLSEKIKDLEVKTDACKSSWKKPKRSLSSKKNSRKCWEFR